MIANYIKLTDIWVFYSVRSVRIYNKILCTKLFYPILNIKCNYKFISFVMIVLNKNILNEKLCLSQKYTKNYEILFLGNYSDF